MSPVQREEQVPEAVVLITFNVLNPKLSFVKANVGKGAVLEILDGWLATEAGIGKYQEPARLDAYHVAIRAGENGAYHTESDTGGHNITRGVLAFVLQHLADIKVN